MSSLIALDLDQIRTETAIEPNRMLIDKFGRVWRGFTGAAAATYTHSPANGTIVPSGADGSAAWRLTDSFVDTIHIPLVGAVFADGTVNGPSLASFGWRLNNAVDDQPFRAIVALPHDIDHDADITLYVEGLIIDDATDNDVTWVVVASVNGGTDIAPTNATVLGETQATFAFTIPAASVPSGARTLYLEVDCAGTLDTSDAVIRGLSLRVFRKSR